MHESVKIGDRHVLCCREAGHSFLQFVERQIADHPGSSPLLVAHNLINFDVRVMRDNMRAVDLQLPNDWHYLDTVLLARKLRPKPLTNKQARLLRVSELQ